VHNSFLSRLPMAFVQTSPLRSRAGGMADWRRRATLANGLKNGESRSFGALLLLLNLDLRSDVVLLMLGVVDRHIRSRHRRQAGHFSDAPVTYVASV
jgi:hypothetical protein